MEMRVGIRVSSFLDSISSFASSPSGDRESSDLLAFVLAVCLDRRSGVAIL